MIDFSSVLQGFGRLFTTATCFLTNTEEKGEVEKRREELYCPPKAGTLLVLGPTRICKYTIAYNTKPRYYTPKRQHTPCTTGLVTNLSLANAHFHTDGQLGVINLPKLHVFRVMEEARSTWHEQTQAQ